MTSIYISCTTEDLEGLKLTLKEYLGRYEKHVSVTVTASKVSDVGVMQRCFADLDQCDVYIGLIGFQYGWVPVSEEHNPDELSMTELEYRRALSRGKKPLLFLGSKDVWPLKYAETDDDKKAKLDRFRQEIQSKQEPCWYPLDLDNQYEVLLQVVMWLVENNLIGAHASSGSTSHLDPSTKPYIGLESFRYQNRQLYFGREAEIDAAQNHLNNDCRFLLITGASGTGKSSLVEAGILPSLRPEAIDQEDESWFYAFRPADNESNPLMGLAYEIADRINTRERPTELLQTWQETPAAIADHLASCSPPLNVIVVDQLEELFTRCAKAKQSEFVEVLNVVTQANEADNANAVVVLASVRSDYLERCQEIPGLKTVLDKRHYIHLFELGEVQVARMIAEPARMVGLNVQEVEKPLLKAATGKADSLPLLSITLSALWDKRNINDNKLTIESLDALGGLEGVMRHRAETAYSQWQTAYSTEQADKAFDQLFSALVQIDVNGSPSRKVALLSVFETDAAVNALIAAMAKEDCRLLSYANSHNREPSVEVVHESLFRVWERLSHWIEKRKTHEGVLAHAELQAREWVGQQDKAIQRLELLRLHDAHKAMKAVGKTPEQLEEAHTRQYLFPVDYLKQQITQPIDVVTHKDRARIGELLDRGYVKWSGKGDDRPGVGVTGDGIPNESWDDYWVDVNGGSVMLEADSQDSETDLLESPTVAPFKIAKYPVTQAQFKAFIAAEDGYRNAENWANGKVLAEPNDYPSEGDNLPITSCAWPEVLAYCCWLDQKMHSKAAIPEQLQIRLPTEWEWQLAASNGQSDNNYPWGERWKEGHANTHEAQLSSLTAVGLYPLGRSEAGALDLIGNCWEWMLNKHDCVQAALAEQNNRQKQIGILQESVHFDTTDDHRVLRGGSFYDNQRGARVGFRGSSDPHFRDTFIGFRVCLSSPIKGY